MSYPPDPVKILPSGSDTVVCPYCDRVVKTMHCPDGRIVMFGHHPTMPWKKHDPLCHGSGLEAPRGQ